ncbi:Membrane domain of glycerophosphoryl diester phosphodiesterase [Streptomyces zhaozhouensis]|uniref:Membrane domain of glycerophosphoryl diester phosphodiesterase n=1 Tax=Streptomyces zhaozhouensis TaxID=1300267 RepID=A0A286E206_9ACTN|nr:glycerophosphoryl diester phosphodiesterase membrane domain-containing protein [Streptomyces zhaozhouensis]SOD64921.1 Membrane domain of glycerophosphoryl diester phosphodiesterase [Streptomyces zhaozhouensis]
MSDKPGWTSPGSPSPDPDNGPQQSPPPQGPPPPAGGPPQGWGQAPGGWGQTPPPGWGGRGPTPLAPKPGVVPLRPLTLGELFDGAVSTARAHWRTVLLISLGIAIVTQVAATIAMRLFLSDSEGLDALENNPDPTDEELRQALGDLAAFTSVTGIVTLLGSVLATAMLTMVVSRAVLGRGVTLEEAWGDSRSRLLPLLGVVLLVPLLAVLAVAVPAFALALTGSAGLAALGVVGGAVLAVWLYVRLSLAAPALMLERQGVIASLRRSAKLVEGTWWRIFGIQLLMLLLVVVVSGVIEFPATAIAGFIDGEGTSSLTGDIGDMTWTYLILSGIGAVIAATLTLPISAGVTALLYIDQRIRREALDLELARAAGLTGETDPAGDKGPEAGGPDHDGPER